MHLQVTVVVTKRWTREPRLAQHLEHLRAAQELLAESAAALDVLALTAFVDGTLDRWRLACREDFAHDSEGCGADAINLGRLGCIPQRRKGRFEAQDGARGPLVAEHLLTRRLHPCQIAQQTPDNRVDVAE